jgi:hypothetical protein
MTKEALHEEIVGLLASMALVFPIQWDRFTHQEGYGYSVYGWIARPDGQRDFVLLEVVELEGDLSGHSFVTSSAKYSEAISTFLGFQEHTPCRKVSELLEVGEKLEAEWKAESL